MRRVVVVGCLLGVLAVASAANATSDSGRSARLIGLAGPSQRFAIVAEESLQEPCEDSACTVYTLDLMKPDLTPRWRHELKGADVLALYLKALGPNAIALTAPVMAETITPIELRHPSEDDTQALRGVRADGSSFRVDIVVLRSFPSMSAYEHHSENPCFSPTLRCSSCRDVQRTVNGLPVASVECAADGGRWAPAGADEPCRCDSTADLVGLRVTTAGRSVLGTQALIEPFRLSQNMMMGRHADETRHVALPEHALSARESTSGALIISGGVAHMPMANGSYFPMLAVVPAAVTTATLARPADSGSEYEGVSVVLPTPPGAGSSSGCAGCAISPQSSARGAWPALGLALMLATRRRRSRRIRPR